MTKEDSLCCSEYSYPLSFLLKGCVREAPIFSFFAVKVYERDTSLVKNGILKEMGWDHRAGSPHIVE